MFPRTGLAGIGRAGAMLALLAGLAFPWWSAGAETRDFYFERLAGERGLAQNSVNALVQDRRGFVWVATQGGLHRFDGERYQRFHHDPRNPATLPDNFVTALALDDADGLWVGTYSQSVARLDLGTGAVKRFPAGKGDAHAARRRVLALAVHDGKVWIGTPGGLERLDPRTGQRDLLLAMDPAASVITPSQALVAGADGAMWFASVAGLHRIGPQGGVERIDGGIAARALHLDGNRRLWVGGRDGLYRLRDDGRALLRSWPRDGDDSGAEVDVRAIVEAPDRRLWLAVAGAGLRRIDPASGAAEAIRDDPDVPASLPEDSINALLVERDGALWAGGQFRGPSITDPRGTRFRFLDAVQPGEGHASLEDRSVRAVFEDRQGGWWIGTDGGRLLRRLRRGSVDDLTEELARAFPVPATYALRVMGFAAGAGDGAWLATTRGLAWLDTRTGQVMPAPDRGLAATSLRGITRDARGTLWLATTTDGLVAYDPASGRVRRLGSTRTASTGRSLVHVVRVDGRGRVWAGTSDGLERFDPATGASAHFGHDPDRADSLPGSIVRVLHQAADGAFWVGGHSGLSRVQEDKQGRLHFTHPLADALGDAPVPVVFSLAESAGGVFWLGTDRGLLRYRPATREVRNYGLRDGLQDLEFNGGAALALRNGDLLFGGVRGLNLFDPRRVDPPAPARAPQVLSVRIGAQDHEQTPWVPGEIRLPADAGLLRLRIGTLDNLATGTVRYRYRVDGYDQDWIDNGSRGEITYTRLPPGAYVLRAQATDRRGNWTPAELRLPLAVAAPAWRHPLALAAYALIAAGLLGALAWQGVQRRREERRHLRELGEREERLKLALWASGDMFWDYDLPSGQVQAMRNQESGHGRALPESHEVHPDDATRVRDLMVQHLRGESPLFLSEHRVRNARGGWTWIRARGRVVEHGPDGRALRVAGTARDISGSRNAERERRIASEVLRSMGEAVGVFDRDFNFVSVNPAFTRISGYGEAEVIGRPTSLLDSPQHDPGFYRGMREELARNGRWAGEMWQQRKDGDEFLCWIEATAVLDSAGQRSLYVAVLTDITDKKRAEQELRYLANYDTLTSLPNRALLSERLSRAIVRARRQDSRIAVLFLDLDRFKDINDSLGHAAGDRILRAAAGRLQQAVGAHHTVARLGGDEFTVVLENIDTPDDAEKVAREIITAFEAPLDIDEHQDVSITPSIGISLYPDNAQVPTDLLKHADTAMYQAKAAGRRTYMRYAETMDQEIRVRASISAALRKVLDRNELRLVYQPKYSLREARITGVEALARWTSQEHGEIPPSQFIPLAEESGLILEIGEWALREACYTLQRWRQHGLRDLTMAVNVSALQLRRGDLPQVVARILEETGIPAGNLELELTESVIMANAEQTASSLQALRDTGVKLAIDDFGTGYSSLAYLKRLPITSLKIDKSFIDDITRDPDDEAITSTVIAMAHSLELDVVAEGVEEEAQLQFLRAHHCDEIQGYWLSPPLDAHRCLALIHTWTPETGALAALP